MDDAKEKSAWVVAYWAYVRILRIVSAEVRRKMRNVCCVCLHFAFLLHSPKNAIFGWITRKEKAHGQERTYRT